MIVACGQLSTADLVARVASSMDSAGMSHPPFRLRPGFCRFCDHPLPHAFAAVGFIDGTIKRADWNEGDAVETKLQLNSSGQMELGNATALVALKGSLVYEQEEGLRPLGYMFHEILLAPHGACAALTDEVFRRASVLVRQRAEQVRLKEAAQGDAKQMVARVAARKAAAALAANAGE